MHQILDPLSSQWQIAFLALTLVMGAMLWRAHRQVSVLAHTADAMTESLERLERTKRVANHDDVLLRQPRRVQERGDQRRVRVHPLRATRRVGAAKLADGRLRLRERHDDRGRAR